MDVKLFQNFFLDFPIKRYHFLSGGVAIVYNHSCLMGPYAHVAIPNTFHSGKVNQLPCSQLYLSITGWIGNETREFQN